MINNTSVIGRAHVEENFNDYFAKIGIQTSHNVHLTNKGFRESSCQLCRVGFWNL